MADPIAEGEQRAETVREMMIQAGYKGEWIDPAAAHALRPVAAAGAMADGRHPVGAPPGRERR